MNRYLGFFFSFGFVVAKSLDYFVIMIFFFYCFVRFGKDAWQTFSRNWQQPRMALHPKPQGPGQVRRRGLHSKRPFSSTTIKMIVWNFWKSSFKQFFLFFWCCEFLLNCLQLALRWFKPHFYFWKKKSIKLAKFLPQCSFISATILQPFSSPFSNNPAIFHQCFLLLLKTSPNPRSRSRPLLTVSTSQTTNWSSKIFMSWSLA